MDDESDDRRCDALGRAGTGTGGAIGLGFYKNPKNNFLTKFVLYIVHRRVAVHLEDS